MAGTGPAMRLPFEAGLVILAPAQHATAWRVDPVTIGERHDASCVALDGVEPSIKGYESFVIPFNYRAVEPDRGIEPRATLYKSDALPLSESGSF